MTKVKITSDTTCDLPQHLCDQWNISKIPLYVNFKGNTYKDGAEISTQEIFDDVKAGGPLPTTAAASIGDFEEFFTELRKEYDEVVHISLSSGLSASIQSARLAAENVPGVYVVDSFALSTGIGQLCRKAALMAEEGFGGAEIAERISAMTGKVHTSFLIDRLDFLYKGGRCSALQLLGSNLLKIKPTIEMPEDTLTLGQKLRGPFAKCLDEYVDNQLKDKVDQLDTSCIFITYSALDDLSIVDAVKERIKLYADFENVYVTTAGSVIASHCGPNTLGILYMVK